MNALPYLAAYMGHTDFRATQYYLRLTADLYPDLISRTEAEFGYVIPEGGIWGVLAENPCIFLALTLKHSLTYLFV
ncbi:hypothetical protein [Paradesulfitobacterium aromaticivorans]